MHSKTSFLIFVLLNLLLSEDSIMLGVVNLLTDEWISILVNDRPYYTSMKFIPCKKIKGIPALQIGSKVCYEGKTIKETEYLDCERCHQPIQLGGTNECDCEEIDMVSDVGELYISEYKMYATGLALKISIKYGGKMLHCVVFHGNAMNELVENIEIGETVKFKAVILKKGEVHDLGNIYHIKKC